MTPVYFAKEIEKILDKLQVEKLGKNVAIKVHFGEKGCQTYINPEIVKRVYNKIIASGRKASLVECNVLYRGSRTNSTSHKQVAKSHGFDFAPIDILDGERGEEFISVGGCKLGKGIKKYDSLIVLSHFKGHMMAGFGGALKNIGMGLGSRAGKLDMHSAIKPCVNKERCTACETCLKNCNAKAIIILDGKAEINTGKCEGCAMCISVCSSGAIQVPWHGGTSKRLQERIADYSKAVLSLFQDAVFINVLENITEDCDCMGRVQKPAVENIGILMSKDIVAIDKASLDLANKKGFSKIQSRIEKSHQIDYAEKIELGKKEYKIVELS